MRQLLDTLFISLLIGLGLIVFMFSTAWSAPVCTTDAAGKTTCTESVPVTGTDPNPLFEFSGQAANPATGQRLTFDKWVMPACGPLIHKIAAGSFTLELTCEPGFTITWTITQKR